MINQLNGGLQINIKMRNNSLLFFALLIVLILIFCGNVSAAEPEESDSGVIDLSTVYGDLIKGKIFGSEEGIKYNKIDDNTNRLTFVGEDASLTIEDSSFENILPKDENGRISYIELDNFGNIVSAQFSVGEEGGEYLINGLSFIVPPNSENSRVYYEGNRFLFPDDVRINKMFDFSNIKEPISVSGKNLNIMDDLIFEGDLQINKYGYFIEEGEANYQGLFIKSWGGDSDQVLIVKNNVEEFVSGKSTRTNWIKKVENSLEIQSSDNGRVSMNFLENNGILDIEYNDKLNLAVFNGDSLKIERVTENSQVFSKINHKSSINHEGSIRIANDGILIDIEDGEKLLSDNLLGLGDILNEKYKSVPFVMTSDSFEEELRIDSNGKLSGILYNNVGGNLQEKVIYELKNSIIDLQDSQLEGLVKDMQEHITDESSLYDSFYVSQDILSSAKKGGFTNEQSLELIKGVIEKTGDNSDHFLVDALSGLGRLESSGLNINPERFNEFTFAILEVAGTDYSYVQKLSDSYNILESGLKEGNDFNLVKDFSSKFVDLDGVYDVRFFEAGVKEYNGNNFEDINLGIHVSNKYGVLGDSTDFLDIKYSNIKDKNALAKEYASAINKYFENPESINQQDSIIASESINRMHDFDSILDSSDSLRESLINELSFDSKYYLISNSIGTSDLYPSTFNKLYDGFNKGNLVEEVKKVDSSGKYWSHFTFQLSARGKLPEAFKENPDFFRDIIYDSLTLKKDNSNYDSFYTNSVLMQDVIYDIYSSPEKYPGEKENLESFFTERYYESNNVNEKAVYSYLLKLNKNPVKKETISLINDLPDIKESKINSDILDRKEIAGKLYFYDDENSYSDAKNDFIKNYGMKVEWSDDSVTRLYKVVGDKKVIIDMELNSARVEYVPSAREDLMNQFYIYLAHRGHCYHAPQTFSVESDSSKIIHDGGCQSYSNLGHLQEKFPNSFVITDKDTGRYIDNDKLIYSILNKIASGELDLNNMNLDFAQDAGFVLPERESLESYTSSFNDN